MQENGRTLPDATTSSFPAATPSDMKYFNRTSEYARCSSSSTSNTDPTAIPPPIMIQGDEGGDDGVS